METILDVACAFVLKGFLPYTQIFVHKVGEDWKEEPPRSWSRRWDLSLYQGTYCPGLLLFNIPHGTFFWSFWIYCPDEWNKWKYLSSQGKTPRTILSRASATTRPQISIMQPTCVDRPTPVHIDFSSVGINMVIESYMGEPDQKIMDEIKKRMVSLMDQEL